VDDRLIDGFGSARAPARNRFRIFALSERGPDLEPVRTVGILDADRDRSIQINLVPVRRKVLGLFSRSAVVKAPWACESGASWLLVAGGRARIEFPHGDSPNLNDVLLPIRAAGPDIATALVLLRAESEHSVTVPPDGRTVRLTTSVEDRVLRIDVHDGAFCSPVFLAPADAPDHDLLPDAWPPLTEDQAAARNEEYAPFLPPLWRAAADLLRDASRPV
jgi:hypothetical protein